MLCFCIIFVNFGGPKYWFRQVFWLFGDSTWKTVHKNSIFTGTDIAVISPIIVRFLVTARANRIWPETTLLADMNIPLYPLPKVLVPFLCHRHIWPIFTFLGQLANNWPSNWVTPTCSHAWRHGDGRRDIPLIRFGNLSVLPQAQVICVPSLPTHHTLKARTCGYSLTNFHFVDAGLCFSPSYTCKGMFI